MATRKTSQRPVTRGRPPRLSRERILAAASGVVAREGVGGLSMRRLAEELDVWPMSVYRYFQDKDALLDAVAESAAGDLSLDASGGDWRERIRQLLEQARAAMGATPADLGERWSRAFLTPGALRLSEAGLAALEEAGFARREAASAWRALWSYTYGFAMFAPGSDPADAGRRTRAAIAGLPAGEYPALTRAEAELAEALSDEAEFEAGLERLLDGLDAGRRGYAG